MDPNSGSSALGHTDAGGTSSGGPATEHPDAGSRTSVFGLSFPADAVRLPEYFHMMELDEDNGGSLKCAHRALVFLEEAAGIGASCRLTSKPVVHSDVQEHLTLSRSRVRASSVAQASDQFPRKFGHGRRRTKLLSD